MEETGDASAPQEEALQGEEREMLQLWWPLFDSFLLFIGIIDFSYFIVHFLSPESVNESGKSSGKLVLLDISFFAQFSLFFFLFQL